MFGIPPKKTKVVQQVGTSSVPTYGTATPAATTTAPKPASTAFRPQTTVAATGTTPGDGFADFGRRLRNTVHGATIERSPPPKPEFGPQAEADKLRTYIMDSHRRAWGGIEQGVLARGALDQKRAANINAMMGRNVGGAFWGGQIQAQMGREQNLMNAQLEHGRQGRALQMEHLDDMIRRNERIEDRDAMIAGLGTNGNGTGPNAGGGGGGGNDGGSGYWEGSGGRKVTAGYVSRHVAKVAASNGRPLTSAEQAKLDAYIAQYLRNNERLPSLKTIRHNSGVVIAL